MISHHLLLVHVRKAHKIVKRAVTVLWSCHNGFVVPMRRKLWRRSQEEIEDETERLPKLLKFWAKWDVLHRKPAIKKRLEDWVCTVRVVECVWVRVIFHIRVQFEQLDKPLDCQATVS